MTGRARAGLLVLLLVGIAGLLGLVRVLDGGPSSAAGQSGPAVPEEGWVLAEVVDGDTVDVARDGVTERVRLLGIDAPESGTCGHDEAARHLLETAGGRPLTLHSPLARDRDRYGRLLAYVDLDDQRDVGLEQISAGLAVAGYDSRSGYPPHPRERQYVAAQADAGAAACPVAPATPSAPTDVTDVTGATDSVVSYESCAAARAAGAAPLVAGEPGFRPELDGDRDGVACEG